jgi:hypothetical protein
VESVNVLTGVSRPLPVADLSTRPPNPSFSPDGNYVIAQERDERRNFVGVIGRVDEDGNVSTIPMPSQIHLLMTVDWTSDSTMALLSSPR